MTTSLPALTTRSRRAKCKVVLLTVQVHARHGGCDCHFTKKGCEVRLPRCEYAAHSPLNMIEVELWIDKVAKHWKMFGVPPLGTGHRRSSQCCTDANREKTVDQNLTLSKASCQPQGFARQPATPPPTALSPKAATGHGVSDTSNNDNSPSRAYAIDMKLTVKGIHNGQDDYYHGGRSSTPRSWRATTGHSSLGAAPDSNFVLLTTSHTISKCVPKNVVVVLKGYK